MRNYIRNEKSGAILNVNRADYTAAKNKKLQEKQKEERLLRLEEKQEEVQDALQRIESLLLGITNDKS
jgi:hypothetical protein